MGTIKIETQEWKETKVIESENPKIVDMVEVVRCKNCKYWDLVDDEIANLQYGECNNPNSAIMEGIFLNEKYYCPDGERRE